MTYAGDRKKDDHRGDGCPARICKDCASAALMDFRHCSCQWKEAV
ncbi:DUF2193 family protein [Methanoregula sp.]|nr:DUF2193 family protein [Methanoregula sp.]